MPERKLEFHPDATFELIEAREFARLGSDAKAKEFATRIDAVLDMLAAFPLSGRVEIGAVRSFTVGDLSYRLVYEVLEDKLFVLALAHTSRRPGYWRDRL